MRILLVLLLAAVGFCGCALFDDDDYLVRRLGAEDIDITELTDHGVIFTFHGQTPDPCHEHYFNDIVRNDSEILVSVYARREKRLICACVVTDIAWPIDVAVPWSGTYLFRFWQSDSTTVDTTLTVP